MERSVDAEDVDGREVEVEFEGVGLPAAEELDVVLLEAGHLGRGCGASTPGMARVFGGVEAHQRQVLANGLDGLVARERRAVGEGEEGSGGRERCGAVERLKGRNGAGRGAGDGGETDGDPFSEGIRLGRREDDVDGGGTFEGRLEGDGGAGEVEERVEVGLGAGELAGAQEAGPGDAEPGAGVVVAEGDPCEEGEEDGEGDGEPLLLARLAVPALDAADEGLQLRG